MRGDRGLAQRVQLGEAHDIGDQRIVLARLRVHGVNLVEREVQSVGLQGEFAHAVPAVDEVAPRGEPGVAQFAVALERGAGLREPVQRATLLLGPHQSELVVLPVQGEQLGGEVAQRLGGHAATAEIGPRRPVAADRTQRDHAAVLVALRSRRIQHLVQLRHRGILEIGCGETAFDDRAVGTRPDPGGVGAGTAEQVQPGHHHRLAGAGLTGQYGQAAVELADGRADRTQRLDADFSQHSVSTEPRRYLPRHPVTGNRNLRTNRSVNGALSSRAHFTGVSQRRISIRLPAGISISRRPSQNTRAS